MRLWQREEIQKLLHEQNGRVVSENRWGLSPICVRRGGFGENRGLTPSRRGSDRHVALRLTEFNGNGVRRWVGCSTFYMP